MKIVTYNIQYARGRDDRFDLGRIAETVGGADVIGLNEVERFWPRDGVAVDQPGRTGRPAAQLLLGLRPIFRHGCERAGG